MVRQHDLGVADLRGDVADHRATRPNGPRLSRPARLALAGPMAARRERIGIVGRPAGRRAAYGPCIPNRFLAVVPSGLDGKDGRELAMLCRSRTQEAWQKIAQSVHDALRRAWEPLYPNWDARWSEQIDHYFEIRTAVLPWRDCSEQKMGQLLAADGNFHSAFSDVKDVRSLADAIPSEQRPRYDQNSAGNWQAKVELSARLMQAQRAIRHRATVDRNPCRGQEFPPKCSLLGSYEQMGPAGLDDSRRILEGMQPRSV
jgi:CRISPR-associated protein Cmr2